MGVFKAVIFTEAGKNYGLGHLSRCIALKSYLESADFAVEIYNRGDYESANAKNIKWLENPLPLLKGAHLVVVDSYYADYEFYDFTEMKSSRRRKLQEQLETGGRKCIAFFL